MQAENGMQTDQRCNAFVIASPEYNCSMPGILKNASKHYRESRKQWVEFPGERPDSPVDRVETAKA